MKSYFCYAPFNTVFIDWTGNLAPCGYMNKEFRIPIHIDEIKNNLYEHPFLQNIRKQFSLGQIPDCCKECNKHKHEKIISKIPYEKYYDLSVQKKIYYSINCFNQCNLHCKMCNSQKSSSIHHNFLSFLKRSNKKCEEYTDILHLINERNITNQQSIHNKQIIHEMVKFLSNSNQITCGLTGGEPLIDTVVEPLFTEILPTYQQNFVVKSSLASNSNLTQIRLENIVKYKANIQISIDGPPHIHDYIRNSKWEIIQNNIDYILKNYYIDGVTTTVTALNLEYLPETIEFIQKNIKPKHLHILCSLAQISYEGLPISLLQKYLDKLNRYSTDNIQYLNLRKNIYEFIKNNKENLYRRLELKAAINFYDELEDKNVLDIYPEWRVFWYE